MTTSPTTTRVSLRSTLMAAGQGPDALPLFAGDQPLATLGCAPPVGETAPLGAAANTLFGPRGAALLGPDGPLWVADTGHHRLLGWPKRPTGSAPAAAWVIGQASMSTEGGRNGGGAVGPATLNVPTGVCPIGDGLAVADAWNHRVLIWNRAPTESHVPADIVLGQLDASGGEPNRGGTSVGPDTMHWPYGVAFDGERLYVADTQNRRVLVWRERPTKSGQPADFALGQPDLASRNENGGGQPTAASMRWPHQVTFLGDRVVLGDAGNNRLLIWNQRPDRCNQPADVILGQQGAVLVDHNQGAYWPTASVFNMPYGVTAVGTTLIAADTANSRIIAWEQNEICTGSEARWLHGQPNFTAKGDNRWQAPSPDSLCWPYAVTSCSEFVVVSDSGNNRVQLWKMVNLEAHQ